jgi:tetratricopeptide (TPR) repeat protein
MTFLSKQHAPPAQWEDFEELCLDIFRALHGDATAQRHGRRGQGQHGIDVYGYFSDRQRLWGVQAKGKDANYGGAVTEAELRNEVNKAKSFNPPISHFTLATTAPRDANLQKFAREITEAHLSQGLFEVQVAGWEDLLSHLARYDEVIEKHYPDQGPIAARLEGKIEGLPSQIEDIVRRALVERRAEPKDPLDIKIDVARDSLVDGQPRSALKILRSLEQKEWGSASPRLRFRILANQGNAHQAMGEYEAAAGLYMRAVEADENNEKAALFKGFALLLSEDPKGAAAAFRAQLERDPANEAAIEGLILASIEDLSVTDPLSVLPEGFECTSGLLAAASRFWRQRGDRKKAIETARTALSQSYHTYTALDLACLLMEPTVSSPEARHGRVLSEEDSASLDEAERLFEEVWGRLDVTEHPRELVITAANLAVIYRFKGDPEKALGLIETALASDPTQPQLVLQKAVHLATLGRRQDALSALSSIPEPDVEIRSFKGDLLAAEEQIAEALTIFRDIAGSDEPRWASIARSEIPVLLFRSGDRVGAEVEARTVIQNYPDEHSGYLALAEILYRMGRADDARVAAREGIAAISPKDVIGRISLSEVLYRLDDWETVSDLLLPLADGIYDTPLLRHLTTALYNADRRADLKRLLDKLKPAVASAEFFLRVRAAFLERIGDLEGCKEALERCIEFRADDLSLRMNWLQCLEQLGDDQKIRAYLESRPTFPAATVRETAGFSHLLDYHGYGAEAMELAYDLLRHNFSDPIAHRALIGLVLLGRSYRAAIHGFSQVQPNAAVRLKQDGATDQVLILEPATDADRVRGEVSADTDTWGRLIGRQVGDVVELTGSGLRSDRWEISEILPKEVHAFRASIERFNHMFPDEQGFIRINTDPENMTPAIEEMASLTSARGDHVRNVADMYQEMPFPLPVLAKFVGSSVIDTWLGMSGKSDAPIRVSSGSHEEREKALQLLGENQPLIVDPLTFFMLNDLGVLDDLVNTFGPFRLTRSALTVLEEFRLDREKSAGRELTIAEAPEGRLSLYTYSPTATRRAYEEAACVLNRAREQEIVPAVPPEDPSQDMRGVATFMDPAFLDSILSAKSAGGVLISEDQRLRQWADSYLAGRSAWIQPLLMIARDRGALSKTKYTRAVVSLIRRGHQFISVDPDSLLGTAAKSSRRRHREFDVLLSALRSDTVEIQSLTGVVSLFVRALWTSQATLRVKVALTRPCAQILSRRWKNLPLLGQALRNHVLPAGAPRGVRRSFERAFREFDLVG